MFIIPSEGKHVVMDAIDMLGSDWNECALAEHLHLSSQLSPVSIVLVDFIKVEAIARTDFFPQTFLEIFDLTGIFEHTIGAVDNTAFFCLQEVILHETGASSTEALDNRLTSFVSF